MNTVEDWEQEIARVARRFPFVRDVAAADIHPAAVKVRLVLNAEVFIQVYVNVATGTRNYALIVGTERRFACDCQRCRNWHRHPFPKPAEHEPARPVELEQFLAEVQELIEREGLL